MTFDLKAAREKCDLYTSWKIMDLHPECEPLCVSNAAKELPAALDEVERLQADIITHDDAWHTDRAANAKRIAELETIRKNLWGLLGGDLGYIAAANSKIRGQRAALQILGKRSGQRGKQIKALKAGWVEERAAKIFYEIYPGVSDYYSWKGYPEDPCQMGPKRSIREEARCQLTAEHPDLFGSSDHFNDATKKIDGGQP